jgi:valyl-tRNA synthetase
METGYDIIFFWVARMMMLAEWLTGREPFGTVYFHGIVRDPYGAKMSKTTGNVVDPLSVIAEVGADALRFALINGTAPGVDMKLGASRLEGARNFANKLWNAARFVVGARPAEIGEAEPLALPPVDDLGPAEHWILQRCATTTAAVEAAYAAFQLGEATRLLHEALWNEYCDWYLELAKVALAGGETTPAARRTATWRVLAWVLDRYLRLLHPVMPFVSEAIWQRLPHLPDDPELLIVARWPGGALEAALVDTAQADGVRELIELLGRMRAARAEAGIDAGDRLDAWLWLPPGRARAAYQELADAVGRLGRVRPALVESLAELDSLAGEGALTAITGSSEARLARSGADLTRERARLDRDLERARAALAQTEERLADARFVERAPAEVVQQVRQRATELRELVARLSARVAP